MHIDILTLFPEMFAGPFDVSMMKRAQEKGLVSIDYINIRDFAGNKHNMVDDTPYGGGAGMVMMPEPILRAVKWAKARKSSETSKVIYVSPGGKQWNQRLAEKMAQEEHLLLLCGHYEGIDQRVMDALVDEEISIGDYVLTGGELPAMVVVDTVVRLIPGVLGEQTSTQEESFSEGLLEYPQYTRPRECCSLAVPEVLLNGHHEQIRLWRRKQSLLKTLFQRPDLLTSAVLTEEDKYLCKEIVLFLESLGLPDTLEQKRKKRHQKEEELKA